MVFRRCPQCHSTNDDKYGFCIRCGYEFSKVENKESICPLCGFPNPDEAEFCVKCGTPLIFKRENFENQGQIKPIVIQRINNPRYDVPRTSRLLIVLGYIFSLLGGLIGLIIAIYLSTRRDPVARKHGHIQLCILVFYIVLIIILYSTGNIPPETIALYKQILQGNVTLENLTRI